MDFSLKTPDSIISVDGSVIETSQSLKPPDNIKIESEIQIKDPIGDFLKPSKHSFLMPVWSIGLGSFGLTAILIFIVSAFAIVLNAPRPALYLENCNRRSCARVLNMKCINSVCNCSNNQIYVKSCVDKVSYMGGCKSDNYCLDSYNLHCYGGKCVCQENQYWNNYKCTQKYSYKESCRNNTYCRTDLLLYCNPKYAKCLCDTDRFWDGHVCFPKRDLLEDCKDSIDCNNLEGLSCVNGACICDSDHYWNAVNFSCSSKKPLNSTCNNSSECIGSMICIGNLCQCDIYKKFSNVYMDCIYYACPPTYYLSANQCFNQSLVNTSCSLNENCREDLGLSCQNNLCQCDLSTQFWSATLMSCSDYLIYNQSCLSTTECRQDKGLICNPSSVSAPCNCPVQSRAKMCDCSRVNGSEYYWNGTDCIAALTYGNNCSYDYMCQTVTQNTKCNITCNCGSKGLLASNNRCKYCSSDWRFFGGLCFLIGDDDKNWNSAKGSCNSYGGSILAVLSNVTIANYVATLIDPSKDYWIGGYFNSTISKWEWSNGDFITNWCPNSFNGTVDPNPSQSGPATCLNIGISTFCYEIGHCTRDKNFICQYQL